MSQLKLCQGPDCPESELMSPTPQPTTEFIFGWLLSGLGITVGYHRYFSHKSFKTYPAVEWKNPYYMNHAKRFSLSPTLFFLTYSFVI